MAYKYFCIDRPPVIGSLPDVIIWNLMEFSCMRYVVEVWRKAYGWIEVIDPLTDEQMYEFGLVESPKNKRDSTGCFTEKRTEDIEKNARDELNSYLEFNMRHLPYYWFGGGREQCIDGMCNMLARGITKDEIARFYGCNLSIVDMVRIGYSKIIEQYKADIAKMRQMFGSLCEATGKNADNEGVLTLLEMILEKGD